MKRFLSGMLFIALSVAMMGSPALAKEEKDPKAIIQNTIDQTMNILRNEKLRRSEGVPGLKRRIIEQVEPVFGFQEMTMFALGKHRRGFNDAQLEELSVVFGELLKKIYTQRLVQNLSHNPSKSNVESVEILKEERQGRFSKIYSVVHFAPSVKRDDVKLNYKLVHNRDQWRIYDLEIEGVSLISNYRSQFDEILTNGTPAKLIERLQTKVQQLESSSSS